MLKEAMKFQRRGRPKVSSDEEQTCSVISEARRVLLEQGYEGMKMDAVAARCRMSKRTIYKLFPSKEALFIALIEDHRSSLFGLPGDYDHLPVDEALASIFKLDVSGEDDIERWAVLRVLKAESAASAEVLAILKANTADKIPVMLSDWIEDQNKKGRLRTDDPRNAAKILLDMMFGCIFDKHGKLCEWPQADARMAYQRQCIDIFVNGCGCGETRSRQATASSVLDTD